MTDQQTSAIDALTRAHGAPTYVNSFKPQRAVYVDFVPSRDGVDRMFRITPDGIAQNVTEAFV